MYFRIIPFCSRVIKAFNYLIHLNNKGIRNVAQYKEAYYSDTLHLKYEYHLFQHESATAFIAEMNHFAEKHKGSYVPLSVNAYNIRPNDLLDIQHVDYFAFELDHTNHNSIIPAFAYRLATTWKRPVFASANGTDWVNLYKNKNSNIVRSWIAQSYAFGHYFMYAWEKWGFTPETGTVWSIVEPQVYTPVTQLINSNKDLFDDYNDYATIGILYDNDFAKNIITDPKIQLTYYIDYYREINEEFLNHGVPVKIIPRNAPWAIDELYSVSTIILPENINIDGKLSTEITQMIKDGKAVYWLDYKSQIDQEESRISITNNFKDI